MAAPSYVTAEALTAAGGKGIAVRVDHAEDAQVKALFDQLAREQGAVHYVFGPAYGAQKAGQDKLAADMAVDFQDFDVAAVSIWMGAVLTDRLKAVIASDLAKFGYLADTCETAEFTGEVIWAMFNDPKLMELSGQTVIGAEMAVKYGFKDVGVVSRRPTATPTRSRRASSIRMSSASSASRRLWPAVT